MHRQSASAANAFAAAYAGCVSIVCMATFVASNVTKMAKRNDSATCLTATRSRPYRLLERKPNIMMHMQTGKETKHHDAHAKSQNKQEYDCSLTYQKCFTYNSWHSKENK
jgi:hypothetical protein